MHPHGIILTKYKFSLHFGKHAESRVKRCKRKSVVISDNMTYDCVIALICYCYTCRQFPCQTPKPSHFLHSLCNRQFHFPSDNISLCDTVYIAEGAKISSQYGSYALNDTSQRELNQSPMQGQQLFH